MKTLSLLRTSVSLLLVILLITGPTASSYAKDDSGKYGEDFWSDVILTAYSTAGTLLAGTGVAAPAGLLLGGIEIITIVLCEEFGCESETVAPSPDHSKPSRQGQDFGKVFLTDGVDLLRHEALEEANLSTDVEEGFAILEDLIKDKRALTVTVERYHRAREKPGKKCTYGGAKIPCYEMQLLHGQWLVDRLDANLRALTVPLRALARSEAVQSVTVTRDEIAEFVADFRATGPPPFEEDLLQTIDATPRERQLLARGHAFEIDLEKWEIPLAELLTDSAVRLLEGRLLRFGTTLPAEFLSGRGKVPALDWDIGTFESETRIERRIVAKNISCPGKQTFEVHARATSWLEIEPNQKLEKIPVGASKEARLEIDLESLPAGEHYGLMTVSCVTCPPPPKCTQSGRRMLVRVTKKSGEVREEASVPASAELDEKEETKLKTECTCKLTLMEHRYSNPNDYRPLKICALSNAEKTESFTEKIDLGTSCKTHCRESFGVESSGVSNAAGRAKKRLAKRVAEIGQPFNWCGGWLSARLDAKGWPFSYRNIAPGLIGVTPVRACSSVPPGLATSCCCGSNILTIFKPFPAFEWSLSPEGHFLRFWWQQQGRSERVEYPHFNEPLVSGSMRRDPFGHGVVALNEKGFIVRTVEKGGQWTVAYVGRDVLKPLGGVRPCSLVTTLEGDWKGIWVVAGERIIRFYLKSGTWRHASADLKGGHGSRIDPSSLYALSNGRIAGTLKNGQRWNVWIKNNDPQNMQFDYSEDQRVVVSPAARCTSSPSC